ncbi:MAG: hypothetical protein JWM85_2713 [Acidimicrobiaceae bacterium]|nr:hypothetical protein [Acidimicrobiaceae bacterium]
MAAVLIAIGLGVGVEAANGPTVYGPPGHRFVAAFITVPRSSSVLEGTNREIVYTARSGGTSESVGLLIRRGRPPTLRQEIAAASTLCRAENTPCRWVAYAPLSGACYSRHDYGSVVAETFTVDSTRATWLTACGTQSGSLTVDRGSSQRAVSTSGCSLERFLQFANSFEVVR